jgi:DNA topoisomerase-1
VLSSHLQLYELKFLKDWKNNNKKYKTEGPLLTHLFTKDELVQLKGKTFIYSFYNRANRAVAILCNHQRAVPKTHEKSSQALQEKIELKREAVAKCEKEFKAAKKAAKGGGSKLELDKKKKAVERMMEQLNKLETQAVDKEENKTIALGTSKLNYLDPRITVAWCKKFEVPLEKVYTKTHRDKFRWAIEMVQGTDEEYEF